MRCSEFNEAVLRYLEGALPEAERESFDEHRDGCPECASHLDKFSELSCRELLDFLCDYVESDLPKEQRRVFDRHLDICSQCVDYVDGYRKTVALGKAAFEGDGADVPLSTEVPDQLVQAILDARRAESEADAEAESETEEEMED